MHVLRRRISQFALFLLPLILFVIVELCSPPPKWQPIGPAKRVNLLLPATIPAEGRPLVNGNVKVLWEEEETLGTDYSFWKTLPAISPYSDDAAVPSFHYPLQTNTLSKYPFDRKAARSIKQFANRYSRSKHHSTLASLRDLWDYERRRGNLSEAEKRRRTDEAFEKGHWKLSPVYVLVRCSATPYKRDPRDSQGQGDEKIQQTVIKRLNRRPTIVGKFTLLDDDSTPT